MPDGFSIFQVFKNHQNINWKHQRQGAGRSHGFGGRPPPGFCRVDDGVRRGIIRNLGLGYLLVRDLRGSGVIVQKGDAGRHLQQFQSWGRCKFYFFGLKIRSKIWFPKMTWQPKVNVTIVRKLKGVLGRLVAVIPVWNSFRDVPVYTNTKRWWWVASGRMPRQAASDPWTTNPPLGSVFVWDNETLPIPYVSRLLKTG